MAPTERAPSVGEGRSIVGVAEAAVAEPSRADCAGGVDAAPSAVAPDVPGTVGVVAAANAMDGVRGNSTAIGTARSTPTEPARGDRERGGAGGGGGAVSSRNAGVAVPTVPCVAAVDAMGGVRGNATAINAAGSTKIEPAQGDCERGGAGGGDAAVSSCNAGVAVLAVPGVTAAAVEAGGNATASGATGSTPGEGEAGTAARTVGNGGGTSTALVGTGNASTAGPEAGAAEAQKRVGRTPDPRSQIRVGPFR